MATVHQTHHSMEICKIQDEEFIQQHIDARDYTSYLFIYNIFNEEEMESVDSIVEYQKRNKEFLKLLSEKGKGGYKVFKRGLAKRGYTNFQVVERKLSLSLSESTLRPEHIIIDRVWREAIDPSDELQILNNMSVLIRKMDASKLTSYLATKQVIDGHDMANVDSLPQPMRNKELLRILCFRGSSAFMWFIESLRITGYGRLSSLMLGRSITSSTDAFMDSVDSDDSDENKSNSISQPTTPKDEPDEQVDATSIKSLSVIHNAPDASGSDRETDTTSKNDNGSKDTSSLKEDESESPQRIQEIEKTDMLDSPKIMNNDMENPNMDVENSTKDVESQSESDNPSKDAGNLNKDADAENEEGDDKSRSQDGSSNAEHQKQDVEIIQDSKENIPDNTINMQDRTLNIENVTTPRSPYQKVTHRDITREPIDCDHFETIKSHMGLLEHSLNANAVASAIAGNGIMDNADVESVKSLRDEQQRVRELISLVLWGGSRSYPLFLEALEKTNHREILQFLKPTEDSINSGVNILKIPSIVVDEIPTLKEDESEISEISSVSEQPQTSPNEIKKHRFSWGSET